MNALASVIQQLGLRTGVTVSTEKMSAEEYIKAKCELYNNTSGNWYGDKGNWKDIDGHDCEKCKNKGYIAVASENGGQWVELHRECSCLTMRRAILRLKKSGLKNIITDYAFEKYEAEEQWQQHLKNKAVEFVENSEGSWFFIGGQSGAGKTHLCTAISGEFLKAGKNVRYMLWRDDVNKLKSRITEAAAYEELINSFKEAEVLYIDDLFKNGKGTGGEVQQPTGADVQTAFEILNYRANNKHLITIISSERSISELIDIDEATGGRIAEMTFEKGFGFNIKPDKQKNYRIKKLINL